MFHIQVITFAFELSEIGSANNLLNFNLQIEGLSGVMAFTANG